MAKRRRRAALATLAASSLLCGPGLASGAQVDPTLQRQFEAAPSKEQPALVVFARQGTDLPAVSPEALRRRMNDLSRADEAWLESTLGRQVRPFWIANTASVSLGHAELEILRRSPRVGSISANDETAARIATPKAGSVASASPISSWALPAVGAPLAWSLGFQGQGVRVGVIDTGIAANHPSLLGRVEMFRDFISGASAPYDDNGHGTAVASLIAGREAPGWGRLGPAPEARLVVAKAMGHNGLGPGDAILAAAQWMLDPDGNPATPDAPSIVNNSWAGGQANQPWLRNIVAAWRSSGIIPVFAAGNAGPVPGTITSPGDYPESFTVGATGEEGAVADFSSRGPVLWKESEQAPPVAIPKPDLVAPGAGVPGAHLDGDVSFWFGTSMAAPIASGVLALMRQAAPTASVDQVLAAARSSAAPLPGGPDAVGAGLIRFSQLGASTPSESSLSAKLPALTSKRTVSIRVSFASGSFYRVRVNGKPRGGSRAASVLKLNLPEGNPLVEIVALNSSYAETGEVIKGRVRVDTIAPRITVKARHLPGGRALLIAKARETGSKLMRGEPRWILPPRKRPSGLRLTTTITKTTKLTVTARDRAGNRGVFRATLSPEGKLSKIRRR